MFEDVTKDIKAQLYEKARSPLAAAFIGAWIVVNVRTVLVFFSNLHVDEKIAYFEAANPTWIIWMLNSLIYPLGSAALVLLIYPHLARWAYEYWHRQYLQVKRIQQQIEDETPITQEEAKSLRKSFVEQQLNLESQLTASSARNAELQKMIDEIRNQATVSREEKEKLVTEINEKDNQISDLTTQLSQIRQSSPPSINDKTIQGRAMEVKETNLPFHVEEQLRTRGLTGHTINIFQLLAENGGVLSENQLIDGAAKVDQLDIKHALNVLNQKNLIYRDGTGRVRLGDDGLSLAVASGLTDYLREKQKNVSTQVI